MCGPGPKARVWVRRVQGPEQAAEKLVMGRETIPQGLKPSIFLATFAARLKSCPDTKQVYETRARIHSLLRPIDPITLIGAYSFRFSSPLNNSYGLCPVSVP